jgi:hypothetical protein
MVALRGLPQGDVSNKYGDPVNGQTYAVGDGDEHSAKLVVGSTFWRHDNDNQVEYTPVNSNSNDEFTIQSSTWVARGYIFSFALANRYVGDVTI